VAAGVLKALREGDAVALRVTLPLHEELAQGDAVPPPPPPLAPAALPVEEALPPAGEGVAAVETEVETVEVGDAEAAATVGEGGAVARAEAVTGCERDGEGVGEPEAVAPPPPEAVGGAIEPACARLREWEGDALGDSKVDTEGEGAPLPEALPKPLALGVLGCEGEAQGEAVGVRVPPPPPPPPSAEGDAALEKERGGVALPHAEPLGGRLALGEGVGLAEVAPLALAEGHAEWVCEGEPEPLAESVGRALRDALAQGESDPDAGGEGVRFGEPLTAGLAVSEGVEDSDALLVRSVEPLRASEPEGAPLRVAKGDVEALAQALLEGDSAAEGAGVPLGARLPLPESEAREAEGSEEASAEGLATLCVGDAEGNTEVLPLPVGEGAALRVEEAQGDALLVPTGLGVGVGVGAAEGEGAAPEAVGWFPVADTDGVPAATLRLGDAVALPHSEGGGVGDAQVVGGAEALGLADGVEESEGADVPETLGEGGAEGVGEGQAEGVAVAHRDGVTVKDAIAEALPQGEAPPVPLRALEGVALAQQLPLRVKVPLVLAEMEGVPAPTVREPVPEGDREPLVDCEGLPLRDTEEQPEALGEAHAEGDALPLPEALGDADSAGERLAEPEGLPVPPPALAAAPVEGERAGESEGDAVTARAVGEIVVDAEAQSDAEALTDCAGDAETLPELAADTAWETEVEIVDVGEEEAQWKDVAVPLREPEPDVEAHLLALRVLVGQPEAEGEGVSEKEPSTEGLTEFEGVKDSATLGVRTEVPLRDAEADTEAHRVVLRENVGLPEAEGEGVTDKELLTVGLANGEGVDDSDALDVRPGVPLRDAEADTEAHRVVLRENVGLPEAEGEGVTDKELLTVGLANGEGVDDSDALGVRPGVPLRDAEADTEAHRVVLRENVGLPEAEGEGVTDKKLLTVMLANGEGVDDSGALNVRQGEPLRGPELDAEAQRVVLRVTVGDIDALGQREPLGCRDELEVAQPVVLGEGLPDALPLSLRDALGLCEELLLEEGEPEAAPEADGDDVVLGEPTRTVALGLPVTRRGLPVRAAEGVVEPLTLRLRVEQPLAEAHAVPLRLRVEQPVEEGHGEGDRLEISLHEGLAEEEGQPLSDKEAVGLCEELLLAEGEPEAAPEADGDDVVLALREALTLAEEQAVEDADEVLDEVPEEVPVLACTRRAKGK
jgi:hypothetical protein